MTLSFFFLSINRLIIFAIWAAGFGFRLAWKCRRYFWALLQEEKKTREMFSLFDLLLTHKIDNGLFMGNRRDKRQKKGRRKARKTDWSSLRSNGRTDFSSSP
jgi:hypothetical protein